MSLIEYFSTRRESIEAFIQEVIAVISVLGRAKYFPVDEPAKLMMDCIFESEKNKTYKNFEVPLEHEYKDQLIAEHKRKLKPEYAKSAYCEAYLENWYEKTIQKHVDQFNKCIDSYIEIADIQLNTLDNTYGKLDFIFENKRLRSAMACETIYNPIRELQQSVAREACHFRLYKEEKENLFACMRFLFELHKQWFLEQEIDKEDMEGIIVYPHQYDKLLDAIERFRCQIYHQKYKSMEHPYVFCQTRAIKPETDHCAV